MTKAELLAERLDTVQQLHAAMAIIDTVLDKITNEPKRKTAPKSKKKPEKPDLSAPLPPLLGRAFDASGRAVCHFGAPVTATSFQESRSTAPSHYGERVFRPSR
jgi:hypothetical protein